MKKTRIFAAFFGLLLITSEGGAQILANDPSFPVLKQLRWDMSIEEVQKTGAGLGILIYTSDSSVTLNTPAFGFAAQTILRFVPQSNAPAVVHVKFLKPIQTIIDSLVSHFTRTLGTPRQFSQEKSVLIFTFRFEFFQWKKPECTIVVQRITKGSTMMSADVVLERPQSRSSVDSTKSTPPRQ